MLILKRQTTTKQKKKERKKRRSRSEVSLKCRKLLLCSRVSACKPAQLGICQDSPHSAFQSPSHLSPPLCFPGSLMNKLIYNRRTTSIVTVKGHNEDRTLSHLFCFLLDRGTRALNKWWTEWNYYERLCKQLWSIENNILNVSARKEVIFMEKGII